ncbi:DUF6207 family protein [Streptomyces sp. NPDC054842]
MRPILDVHVAEPGLAVVEIAAADDATAFAIQQLLTERWATARADGTPREPGEPGVRLRFFADLRQEPNALAAARCHSSCRGPSPVLGVVRIVESRGIDPGPLRHTSWDVPYKAALPHV